MPMAQPATEATTMVSAGSTACDSTLKINGALNPGLTSVVLYPEFVGNQPSLVANTATIKIATKKYGAAWKNVIVGSRLSSQLPRRQAAAIPSSVPSTKLMIVARPTRPIVHGSAARITLVTVAG